MRKIVVDNVDISHTTFNNLSQFIVVNFQNSGISHWRFTRFNLTYANFSKSKLFPNVFQNVRSKEFIDLVTRSEI
jgi:uncharacterized protein YjbI with pentapeptide repeats